MNGFFFIDKRLHLGFLLDYFFRFLFFSRDTKHFSREPYRKFFFYYLKQDVLIHKQMKVIFIL